jgi:hypothetical protein
VERNARAPLTRCREQAECAEINVSMEALQSRIASFLLVAMGPEVRPAKPGWGCAHEFPDR